MESTAPYHAWSVSNRVVFSGILLGLTNIYIILTSRLEQIIKYINSDEEWGVSSGE
jgi:hypothetical protein